MDGQYRKGDRTMSTNEWLLTADFWQFLEPWHGRWYENEIFIASCTDNIYDLENERWLLGDMIDHVGIYGSRVAEGLSAFNVGLVLFPWCIDFLCPMYFVIMSYKQFWNWSYTRSLIPLYFLTMFNRTKKQMISNEGNHVFFSSAVFDENNLYIANAWRTYSSHPGISTPGRRLFSGHNVRTIFRSNFSFGRINTLIYRFHG